MKLVDSTQLILNSKSNKFVTMNEIIHAPEIDPIHAAGACYCKECKYYTYLEIHVNNKERCVYYCNRPLGTVGPITVMENDFCSHGEIKD